MCYRVHRLSHDFSSNSQLTAHRRPKRRRPRRMPAHLSERTLAPTHLCMLCMLCTRHKTRCQVKRRRGAGAMLHSRRIHGSAQTCMFHRRFLAPIHTTFCGEPHSAAAVHLNHYWPSLRMPSSRRNNLSNSPFETALILQPPCGLHAANPTLTQAELITMHFTARCSKVGVSNRDLSHPLLLSPPFTAPPLFQTVPSGAQDRVWPAQAGHRASRTPLTCPFDPTPFLHSALLPCIAQ